MLFEMSIPVVERDIYSIFEIIPIPTILHKPTLHYVLLDSRNHEYIPITDSEYAKSKFNIAGERIIKPIENSHTDHSKSCEVSFLINPDSNFILNHCDIRTIPSGIYSVPIILNDLYHVSVPGTISIKETCNGDFGRLHEIRSSGVFSLTENCHIIMDKIILRKRSELRMDMGEIKFLDQEVHISFENSSKMFSDLNDTVVPTSNTPTLVNNFIEDFNELANKADEIIKTNKYDKKFKEMYFDKIFHWIKSVSTSTIIVIVAIIFLGIYIYRKLFNADFWDN